MDVVATVVGVWSRPLECQQDRSRAFVRNRISEPVGVNFGGLDGSEEFHREKRSVAIVQPLDRAVLVQTTEHYEQLRERFPQCEGTLDASRAAFGEQLTMKGFDASVACIGDVFASEDSPLVLQVTGPRLPCRRVDMRHPVPGELPSGAPGTVRQHCAASGRAGVFFKVLTPGPVREGDFFRRVRRGQEQWSTERVSACCYPTTPVNLTFNGTPEELEELCKMEGLMVHEWQDRLQAARAAKARAPVAPAPAASEPAAGGSAGGSSGPPPSPGLGQALSAAAGVCFGPAAAQLRALVDALGVKPGWVAAFVGEKAAGGVS